MGSEGGNTYFKCWNKKLSTIEFNVQQKEIWEIKQEVLNSKMNKGKINCHQYICSKGKVKVKLEILNYLKIM